MNFSKQHITHIWDTVIKGTGIKVLDVVNFIYENKSAYNCRKVPTKL